MLEPYFYPTLYHNSFYFSLLNSLLICSLMLAETQGAGGVAPYSLGSQYLSAAPEVIATSSWASVPTSNLRERMSLSLL